jgi:membrane associated rhomboid family serine protease
MRVFWQTKKPLARGLDNLPGWNKEKRRHTSRRFRASQKRPAVTLAITVINIAVYAIISYENFFISVGDYWVKIGGFVPSLIATPPIGTEYLPQCSFTGIFSTYSSTHDFLYLFGRGVEDAVGWLKFLALYMISGVGSSVFHTAFSFLGGATGYVVPAIGASVPSAGS